MYLICYLQLSCIYSWVGRAHATCPFLILFGVALFPDARSRWGGSALLRHLRPSTRRTGKPRDRDLDHDGRAAGGREILLRTLCRVRIRRGGTMDIGTLPRRPIDLERQHNFHWLEIGKPLPAAEARTLDQPGSLSGIRKP